MIKLSLNKTVVCPWSVNKVISVIKPIAQMLKVNGELEVNIVDDKEIKKLNKTYRGINKVTDVLSFAWREDELIKSDYLGQIYISYTKIVKQAKEYRVSANEEFARMLAHGFLHLLGYDHQTESQAQKMFSIQQKAVARYLKKL